MKESLFIVPLPHLLDNMYNARVKRSNVSCIAKCSLFVLFKFFKFMMNRSGLYKHLSRRGVGTIFWVVQNDFEFKKSIELGAHGMMTDYPSRLTKFYDNHLRDNSKDSKSHSD
jgi:glycerophosphoryl diester phosphodiesterase